MEDKYKKEIDLVIERKAMQFALDKEMQNTTLIGMINVYVNYFNEFSKKNNNKINKFFLEIKTKNLLSSDEIEIVKIFYFINSWDSLIDKENESLNKKEFNSYIKLNPKEIEKWDRTINYAEKEMKLKGIRKLNNKLQFIISFNESADLRKEYFKFALIENWKEQERRKKEKEDFRNKKNIYEKLFQYFQPEVNQYNYS